MRVPPTRWGPSLPPGTTAQKLELRGTVRTGWELELEAARARCWELASTRQRTQTSSTPRAPWGPNSRVQTLWPPSRSG